MNDKNILQARIREIYNEFGQRKPMGNSAITTRLPHYFLLRTFANENDLLMILNTKRCRYQCHFCQLPAKSVRFWVPTEDILAQFENTIFELKHSLSIIDRVTLSNEGSVLDTTTFPTEALIEIARCVHELRRVRTLVLETRLEFINTSVISDLQLAATRVKIDILTGFETLNREIRDNILVKKESIDMFLNGLDIVAECRAHLTSYVLYKSAPSMTDEEAFTEAERTIDYLVEECQQRNIPLLIRLNPMYKARDTKWAALASDNPKYLPPRLTDVMRLAEKKAREGVKMYIGLSTEGLDESGGSYHSREDYMDSLLYPIKLFNDGKIDSFQWDSPK